MRKSLLIALTTGSLVVGTAALAAFADIDSDGDGLLSADEFAAGFPDLGAEAFVSIDTDADGMVSEPEHVAAVEAGLLPAE